MIVSIIVAMDDNQGIGKNNTLPWRLSDDLKRFKQLTMGHHIIMGRKTYESIGKPLPGRQTIIVTRNKDYQGSGSIITHSLDEAIQWAKTQGEDEAFICGGASIFEEALKIADRIYLTLVHAISGADVFFPPFDPSGWKQKSASKFEADERNEHPTTFMILER